MIRLKDVEMEYDNGTRAIKGITLTIEDGEFVFLVGPSGSGKSTIIKLLTGEVEPCAGRIMINGFSVSNISEKQIPLMRRTLGVIFQDFRLIEKKTVYDNLAFVMRAVGASPKEIRKRIPYVLELVGLGDKASAYPAQLSGGQQQRVAIARALATNPKVLLCDEATSALDPKTTNAILELIREINQKLGITVIIITHQMSVVESTCRHVAILEEGQVVEQGEVSAVFSHPKSEAARRLVFPEGNPESLLCSLPGSRLIRVVFNGADATGKPIIARMATEIGVEANIAYASTRSIEGRAYGSMLLSIEDKDDDLARAIGYLTQDGDITAQEVTQYAE